MSENQIISSRWGIYPFQAAAAFALALLLFVLFSMSGHMLAGTVLFLTLLFVSYSDLADGACVEIDPSERRVVVRKLLRRNRQTVVFDLKGDLTLHVQMKRKLFRSEFWIFLKDSERCIVIGTKSKRGRCGFSARSSG